MDDRASTILDQQLKNNVVICQPSNCAALPDLLRAAAVQQRMDDAFLNVRWKISEARAAGTRKAK
jgi:hypothetical protein